MWTIFKVFIEFVTILFLFGLVAKNPNIKQSLKGLQGSISLTRGQTCTPCIGRWSLNHRSSREVP